MCRPLSGYHKAFLGNTSTNVACLPGSRTNGKHRWDPSRYATFVDLIPKKAC